jgi:hypothetical protein
MTGHVGVVKQLIGARCGLKQHCRQFSADNEKPH